MVLERCNLVDCGVYVYKNCKSFVKIWKINIKDDFMRMLDNLCVEEIKVK